MVSLCRISLLFLLISSKVFCADIQPDSSYSVLKNFDKDWHIYDAESKHFIPELSPNPSQTQAHTVFFDRHHFSRYELMILSQNTDALIYINGALFKALKADNWLYISVKSLPKTDDGLVMLTVYGSRSMADKKVLIGSRFDKTKVFEGVVREHLLNMKNRVPLPFKNSCLLVFCGIFIYTTLLSSSNAKAFGEYFSVGDIFITRIRDTKYLISKPLNRTNQAFVLLLSLSSAFLYVILAANGLYLLGNKFNLGPESGALHFLLVYFAVALLAYILYFLKLIFLNIMARLFGLEKSVNVHYFKSIQFTLLWIILLSLLFYIYYLQQDKPNNIPAQIAFWALLLGYLLRSLLVYLSILKSTGIQSLYLIAYLCVVELLPITVGIRLAF